MQKTMLKRIAARLKEIPICQLATELGYRSQITIYNWRWSKRIPKTALHRVKRYFEKLDGKNDITN